MKHNRIITMLLLAAMLTGTISCGSTPAASDDTTTAGETTTAAPVDTSLAGNFTPEIAKELELEGYEFNVFLRKQSEKWSNRDVYAEEENGETLNDAVFQRNRYLEETFGFTIKVGYSANTQLKELSTQIMAGDDTYDAAFPMGSTAGTIAQEGGLVDLNTLEYLNFESDVWNNLFNSKLTYDGKLFYATGDIAINSYESLYVMMFNKDMITDLKLDNPYEMVTDKKWTLDAFGKMCAEAAHDVNGDSKMDMNDRWGLATQQSTGAIPFYYGTGEMLTDLGSDGIPTIAIGGERSHTAFATLQKLFDDDQSLFLGATADALKLFQDGQALFYNEVMYQTVVLRSADIEFGLLPMPMLDETQDNYYAFENGWCISPAVIPKTAKNAERSGFILQAMAEASREYIRPAYYETVLVGKQLRDDESAAMLDVIFGSFALDPSQMYSWGGINTTLLNTAIFDGELMSLVDSGKTVLQEAINKTTEVLK